MCQNINYIWEIIDYKESINYVPKINQGPL